MLHDAMCNDDLSATHRYNVGTMLQPSETMTQQCCDSVLHVGVDKSFRDGVT